MRSDGARSPGNRARSGLIGTAATAVLVILVAAICVRLGFWQLSRHAERSARNARIESRAGLPAVDVNREPMHDSLAFRMAVAEGNFDWQREIVEYGRSLSGVPGVVLAAPLVVDSGIAVIVERGWVPSPDARAVALPEYREAESAVVRGLLLPTESSRPIAGEGWPLETRAVDPEAIQSRFPYALVPLVLRRVDTVRVNAGWLQPFPPPEPGLGPHLSYAVQWFLFATIAVVGAGAVYVRSRRADATAAERY